MYAKPEKVRRRRVKRQLKAAFAIGVALAAGVFLACQKTVSDTKDAETDARGNPSAARDPGLDKPVVDASLVGVEDAGAADSSGGPVDARSDALATVDASKADSLAKRPANARDAAAVDRREHRKGMPVPDNLLE